jgi:hypothetical protein
LTSFQEIIENLKEKEETLPLWEYEGVSDSDLFNIINLAKEYYDFAK